jgi:ABC-type uncharacterized transport system substrate-binding protein
MRSRTASAIAGLGLAAGIIGATNGPAAAHPHVWVEVQTTVEAERGAFAGIRQRWTFDEFYSSMAIEGLDANKDGRLDRDELAELTKVNMEGLKEFGYFTVAFLGGQQLKFAEPTSAFLDHVATEQVPGPQMEPLPGAPAPAEKSATGTPPLAPSGSFWQRAWDSLLGKSDPPPPQKPKVLVLEFVLPFEQPVLTEAEGFTIATYDPSFFIWFDVAKSGAAKLVGAPAGCAATVRDGQKDAADVQRLGESFFNTMGGPAVGGAVAKSIVINCPKT